MGKTPRREKYTAAPCRDLGHARWCDPLAALEDPKSAEFKAAVKTEDANWSQALQHIPSSRLAFWRQAMARYQSAAHPVGRKWAEVRFRWCGHHVAKQRGPAGYSTYLWIDGWHLNRPWSDAGFGTSGWFYTLEDIGKGSEHLELTVWHWSPTAAKPRAVWRRDPVGPSVEIVGDRIYFSTVDNLLRYPDLWVAPLETGKGARCLYSEPDKRYQVSFMERGGTFFVHKANALDQELAILEGETLTWIANAKGTLVPVGGEWYACNDALVHYVTGKRVSFPKGHWLEDACLGHARTVLVILVCEGRDSLWVWNSNGLGKWECIKEGPKGLVNSISMFHDPTEHPVILCRSPIAADEIWTYLGTVRHRMRLEFSYPEPLRLAHFGGGFAIAEGAHIPYTWVSAVRNPVALLVEGYGSYGISSRRAYPERWLAYLAAGWAIAYVCPRGGREGGDAWWDAGRTSARKATTFSDTAAGIVALQKSLHIPPSATVFYGRSAGGWLAANIAQDHGDLVAAVYAEVPFVDVLRTTTNPTLPLTQLEYDEFGDPRSRPAEYRALRKISPVDTVPACVEGKCPLIIVRTALHDTQVLPYETLKWAARLRAAGWGRVYAGIDHDGGHFAAAKSMVQQRAEDVSILETAITYQPVSAARTLRKKSVKRSRRAGTAGRTRRPRRTSS